MSRALCDWCGEEGATLDGRLDALVCGDCALKLVRCGSCGDLTDHGDTVTCWDCEQERDARRLEDDGSPKFSRFLAGMGGRVQP